MSLKSHLRTHTEEKRHKCPDCGRSFRVSSQLPSHHCPAQAIQEQEEGQRDGSYSFQRGQGTSSPDVDSRSGMEGSSGSMLSNLEKYIAESVVPADFSQQVFPIKMKEEKQDPLLGHEEDGEEPGLLAAMEDERRYKCNQCDKAYKHPGSLTNHKQSHTLGVYQCAMCYKEFSNLMALRSHARLHSEYRPYKCRFCHKAFRLPSELLSHQKAHSQEESKSTDPSQYSNLMALRNHVRVHLRAARMRGKELGDSLTCSNCGESFEEEAEFQLHQLRHLPCTEDIEAAEVPRLGVLHSQEADLLQTIKQDVEALENGATVAEDILPALEMPHICHQCGLAFPTVAGLQTHAVQHGSGRERLDGVVEGTEPPVPIQRLSETLMTTNEDTDTEAGATMPMVLSLAEELRESCSVLEKDATANGWQTQSQASSPLPDNSEGLPYHCEQCGLGFDQAKNLIDHRQTHQAGNVSYQCSLSSGQDKPIAEGHAEEQPFLCSLCGMIFPSEESLQDHHSLLHEEGEGRSDSPHVLKRETEEQLDSGGDPEEEQLLSHICGYCGQTFDDMASLEEHSNGHLEEKAAALADTSIQLRRAPRMENDPPAPSPPSMETLPLTIEKEEEGAAEEKGSQAEEEDSLLERPFQCDVCGRSYKHAGSLINHKQTHKTGLFHCSICQKQFYNLMALKNHNRTHFETKRYRCAECPKAGSRSNWPATSVYIGTGDQSLLSTWSIRGPFGPSELARQRHSRFFQPLLSSFQIPKSVRTDVRSVGARTAMQAACSTTRRATRSGTSPVPCAARLTPTSCP
uniref:C2H2-type domain-containing protein n=1 Tax=Naja naja TaxID=35670 RepID=A0A8C6Y673_NAJNA